MKNLKAFVALGLVAALAGSAAPAHAKSAYSASQLRSLWNATSKRESKLVTSNSVHFWAWARNEAENYVADYLEPTGIVIGDPHPRNVFDYRDGGKAKLAVADIDDSGEAPLFLDMVRYVTYLESLDVKMKIGDIFDAYVDGLKGKTVAEPSALTDARDESEKDIKAAHLKYIGKHTKKDGTKFDNDDLGLTGQKEFTSAQEKMSNALGRIAAKRTGISEVLDVGYKVNDSGSSADMDRYWILLGEDDEARLIVEFKELGRSAVSYYQRQAGTAGRVKSAVEAYSENGLDDTLFGVVSSGGKDFWMRPRHYQALDLKDDEYSEKEQREFAEYVANWMGRAQRGQADGAKLLKLIEQDRKAAKDALEGMVRAYLDEIGRL